MKTSRRAGINHWSRQANDNHNRNLSGGRLLQLLAASISLQDQLVTSRRAILGMDLRMGSLVRLLAVSLHNGRLVLVEGEEVTLAAGIIIWSLAAVVGVSFCMTFWYLAKLFRS